MTVIIDGSIIPPDPIQIVGPSCVKLINGPSGGGGSSVTGAWTITFTVTGSGWVQDFPNDADFWLQQGASAGANQLQSVSGTGDSNGVFYWEADRNFGTSSRSGQLQLRTGTATGTIVDTIDFTQDA